MEVEEFALEVLSDYDLNSTQKLVMIYILMNNNHINRPRITNKEFIEVFRFDESTLSRALKKLEAQGYITRQYQEGVYPIFRTINIEGLAQHTDIF